VAPCLIVAVAAQVAAEFVSEFHPDASTAPLDLIAQLVIDPKITRHKCVPAPATPARAPLVAPFATARYRR
jgi:hypothetical protein